MLQLHCHSEIRTLGHTLKDPGLVPAMGDVGDEIHIGTIKGHVEYGIISDGVIYIYISIYMIALYHVISP